MTKNDLMENIQLVNEVEELKLRIESIEAKLFYAKGLKLDGMPRSNAKSDITDLYNSYIELKETYLQKLLRLIDSTKAVVEASERLSPVERRAIQLRYIDGKPVSVVACELGYEERHTYRILREAESKLCQQMADGNKI